MKKGIVIDPKKGNKIFMMGSADEKSQREINWLIDEELVGSEQFVGGLATFYPGMTAPLHAHSDAEEINVVLEGEGKLVTPDGVSLLKKGDWQFPKEWNIATEIRGKLPLLLSGFILPLQRPFLNPEMNHSHVGTRNSAAPKWVLL